MKKSAFFDFLNRYRNHDFESFLAGSKEDVDFINWNGYCLPMTYGDGESEYRAVRSACALFDASPVKKYKISGAHAGAFLDAMMTRRMSRQKSMRVSYAIKIMITNVPRPNSAFPGQWIWIAKTTLSARPLCSKKKKGVRDSKPSA